MGEMLGKKELVEKTIIYCYNTTELSEIYAILCEAALDHYPDDAFPVYMFHRCTPEECKQIVMDEFPKETSFVRIVVATCALGMGVNIPDIRTVIHYGLPSDIESYCQEIGRGGRDNKSASAELFYTGTHYANCKDTAMKDYARNLENSCRRVVLLRTFDELPIEQNTSECCDICTPPVNVDQIMAIDNTPHRHVSAEERQLFGELLKEHNAVHQNTSLLTFGICNTFTESMISELKNNCDSLFLFDDIQHRLNIISPKLVQTVLMMLDDIFGDIDDAEIQKGSSEMESDIPCDISSLLLEPYEDQISQESSQDCASNSQTSQSQDSVEYSMVR